MPFQSKDQERWGHTPEGEKALGGPKRVAEWDNASKGKDLPEKKDSPKQDSAPAHNPKSNFGGQAHEFPKTHKAGKLRVSGHSGAHRIGKR